MRTVPGLDAVVALHAALCGRQAGRAQGVPVECYDLLAEVAPVLDLLLHQMQKTDVTRQAADTP